MPPRQRRPAGAEGEVMATAPARIRVASSILALLSLYPVLAVAGGWYLMAPNLTEVLLRTQKNAGLGDIPINTWQTLGVFDTATQCKAGRQAAVDKVPNPWPRASDSLIARWAQLQTSECIAPDDLCLAPRKTQ